MPRIIGVDVPGNKRLVIALTYIYGIGQHISEEIIQKLGLNPNERAKELTEDDIARINNVLQTDYLLEGDLRRKVNNDITKVKARNYLIKESLSDGTIVEDIGFNIPNANYVELGISYFGGNLKEKWRSMIVEEGNRLTYDEFMISMFTNNIAKPIIVDAGKWFDVNTARDKIKAELFLQNHAVGIYGSTKVSGGGEATRELNQDFVFQLAKTKNTVITIKSNILKNISQFEIIPESLIHTPHFIVTDSNLYDLIG